MADIPKLVVLSVSPWSERARWALDHHALSYRTVEHMPFLGERRLRRLTGPGKQRPTVPVLIDGDTVLTESWDIAQYADRVGHAPKLIPPDRESEIRRWTDRADRSMTAGRALIVASMLRSPQALDEGAPPQVPSWLRPVLRPMVRYGTRWFARKYGLRLDDSAGPERELRAGLDALRVALGERGPCLLGAFSYADIAMATLLQGVSPVSDDYLRLGPATRQAWTQPGLASDYADLLKWRDELYHRHRSRPHKATAAASENAGAPS